MRMCPGSTAGRQWVRIQCRPPPGTRDPGSESPSFFLSDSRERPARRMKAPAVIRRNWVGPGSYLGPEDGSIPSCASNGCRSRGIYLDSRQRPARRSSAPAVIRSGSVRSLGCAAQVRTVRFCPALPIASPVSADKKSRYMYFLCGSIDDMVCRSLPRAAICSICVGVAQQPSKLLGPVRVRYAAPAGRIRPFLPFG